ncbi:MAG TPA: helicase HerA-like domain-containing protein [Anaeromyxobacteraceae bacterium]|nr:helicase HerA-like domain-containing protein [Anaeromyxobacteraceae bacterium]
MAIAPLPVATARDHVLSLAPSMGNRHGLVAGATGTGKTVTLRVLTEGFSRMGVPVFLADVKGDLSGLARAGADPRFAERAKTLGLEDWAPQGCPVTFWEVGGGRGHPVRTTVSEMGPLLLSRILNLNDVQSGLLTLVFRVADDAGLLLLDLKDLRAMLQHVSENARELQAKYGNVSAASVGAIQRSLLGLEEEGGDALFGEPALDVEDLMQTASDGRGVVNVLVADKLVQTPRTYATLLLWMMSELFERLPEVGDPEKPRLVFFFDEAHLLFTDAPKVLQEKIEQVVRLIRSKGVGVYFVTQNPLDLPDTVLGQLGNRVQHALRAFTPRDQKAVRAAAETFRANPDVDVETAITQLAVGEALVSLLDATGTPEPVSRAKVHPPRTQLPPLAAEDQQRTVRASLLYGHYEKAIDRESAYEQLRDRAAQAQPPLLPAGGDRSGGGWGSGETEARGGGGGRRRAAPQESSGMADAFSGLARNAARAAGTQLGREIMRGVLGSIFGGARRRR